MKSINDIIEEVAKSCLNNFDNFDNIQHGCNKCKMRSKCKKVVENYRVKSIYLKNIEDYSMGMVKDVDIEINNTNYIVKANLLDGDTVVLPPVKIS